MRKFISGLLAIAAAAFTGCYESGTDADNTSREARISISPAAIGFDADGRTGVRHLHRDGEPLR